MLKKLKNYKIYFITAVLVILAFVAAYYAVQIYYDFFVISSGCPVIPGEPAACAVPGLE